MYELTTYTLKFHFEIFHKLVGGLSRRYKRFERFSRPLPGVALLQTYWNVVCIHLNLQAETSAKLTIGCYIYLQMKLVITYFPLLKR